VSRTDRLTLSASGPLRGTIRAPGDKSIAHRALILAALADGTSNLSGLPAGDDVRRTKAALAALGCYFDGDEVVGGRGRLRAAKHPLDAGNSGTTVRLLAGVAASLPFESRFDGDDSLRRRPMARVVEPLVAMGAAIESADGRLPMLVRGGELRGIDYTPPVSSAQVKGAVLLAGIGAEGETTVREPVVTRRHTEELLSRAGASIEVTEEPGAYAVKVRRSELVPIGLVVPGDPSQAAFIAVAAALVPGSSVRIEGIYTGRERIGFVEVLRRMGAKLEIEPREPHVGDLVVESAPLQGTEIGGHEVASLVDEIPVLAVAACFAEGTTTISGAAELRVKESDRIATMSEGLNRLGASVEERPDGFVISGGSGPLEGEVSSFGDHRVAMALAVAALAGGRRVLIDGFSATATSWPGFLDDLGTLT
jgi:3-phosphoshikimate 1-carboxyvinyltransferase